MSKLKKASAALTGALVAQGLASEAMAVSEKPVPPAKAKKLDAAPKKKPAPVPQVEKVPEEDRRPSLSDPDLGMPAGTRYDVIRRRDVR